MTEKAFALNGASVGTIVLCSIRYSARHVQLYAIETEREYFLEQEDYSDEQIWRRLYRQGYRVVPVSITSTERGGK
jgi:hypothetical protein